ncbi:MAG: recombination regulator RecX [Eggerthellaceae bacterium]|nr:recombination regulator RecX [Eggerthellaceae bacterium]
MGKPIAPKPAQQSAFERIAFLVSFKERSKQEMFSRLVREGFPEQEIEEALVRAENCDLINDARFAEMFVRSRMNAGRGMQGIDFELQRLGINRDAVSEGEEGSSFEEGEDELTRALAFLERKPPKTKNKRDGAYRKLLGRGFASSVAATAAKIWSENLD